MSEITFHPDVAKEIKASYIWYQNQAKGLGDDYLTELEASYQAIVELQILGLSLKKVFVGFC